MDKRFVNIKEVKTWMEVERAMQHNISTVNPMHCKECGDTTPKHGFYPLLVSTGGSDIYQTSSLTCNRCRLSDEEYLKLFDEPKEIINFENKK